MPIIGKIFTESCFCIGQSLIDFLILPKQDIFYGREKMFSKTTFYKFSLRKLKNICIASEARLWTSRNGCLHQVEKKYSRFKFTVRINPNRSSILTIVADIILISIRMPPWLKVYPKHSFYFISVYKAGRYCGFIYHCAADLFIAGQPRAPDGQ